MTQYKTPEQLFEQLPAVQYWPWLQELITQLCGPTLAIEDHALTIGSACGGTRTQLAHTIASATALMTSIRLVDDVLDEDPDGIHHEFGEGMCSNAAVALQSVGIQVLEDMDISAERKLALIKYYNRGAVEIAVGQKWDVEGVETEEDYWRLVRMKSSPYYGMSHAMEAIAAGLPLEYMDQIYALGEVYGEVVQIQDDIEDVMSLPPTPDWILGKKSLPNLYGLLVDHPEKERFTQLFNEVQGKDLETATPMVEEARQILLRCGAISYSAHRVIKSFNEAIDLLDTMEFEAVGKIRDLYTTDLKIIHSMFQDLNAPLPS